MTESRELDAVPSRLGRGVQLVFLPWICPQLTGIYVLVA